MTRDIIINGEWDGQPIWREKTLGERLLEAIEENIRNKQNEHEIQN